MQLPFEEPHQIVDGIEVVWNQLPVLNLDPVRLFQKDHEFQNAGGVDDPLVQERVAAGQMTVGLAKKEIVNDKLAQFLLDVLHRKIYLQSF